MKSLFLNVSSITGLPLDFNGYTFLGLMILSLCCYSDSSSSMMVYLSLSSWGDAEEPPDLPFEKGEYLG